MTHAGALPRAAAPADAFSPKTLSTPPARPPSVLNATDAADLARETALALKNDPAPYELTCMDVWGSNRKIAREFTLPGLIGWVCSRPFDQLASGGDVHYLSVCDRGLISRVALADVSGHGQAVTSEAELLLDLMRRHINTWDQSEFMRDLDASLFEDQQGAQYATAVLLGYYRKGGQLVFTNAGHPPPLWFHAAEQRWAFLEHGNAPAATPLSGLPIGLISGTSYQQSLIDFAPGDMVILYTDAILEAVNQEGRQFGPARLFELAKTLPTGSPAVAGRALQGAVKDFRNGAYAGDDETLIVLQRIRENFAEERP